MPPENENPPPDSALGLMNIHQAAGLDDRARKRVWETTRQAIERQSLELQGEIAAGATAVVFDAREKVGGRLVGRRLVVKVIVEPENAHALACFRREVKILASEHVPTDVVPSLKYHQDVDDPAAPTIQPFLVAERIEGRPILDYVRHPRSLPIAGRIELIERGFLALERLHSCNILHGDVSPNNWLVQKDDIVRLIDLGLAKPLRGVGTRSVSVAGGTPDYQPDSVLNGQDRLAVWADIHALASVAFHALTDRPPGKKPENTRANGDVLSAAGVPPKVARVLLKALRVKDQRKETDQNLYASAAAVARDLRIWRERQARRATLKRQAVVALLVALPLLVAALSLAWDGWSRYWEARRADEITQIKALRSRASQLSHDNHHRVKELTARAEELTRAREAARDRGQTDQADAHAHDLLDTLRQVVALREGLERCLPLRKALAEVLALAPWHKESEAIARDHRALEQRDIEITTMIERGETDAAWVALGNLHADLAKLAQRNLDAEGVAEPRARLKRARDVLSAKLRELGAADPIFARMAQDADDAEKAWKAGEWPNAKRLFGIAQQALDKWLVGKETHEELAARLAADGASALAAAKREQAFRDKVESLERIEKELTGQVHELQSQITRLTGQNLRDRDAKAAAETRANNLSAKLDQEREAAKQTTEALVAVERSAKVTALQAKATAESERDQTRQQIAAQAKDLTAKEAALKGAIADLQAWKTRTPSTVASALSDPPPSTASVAGWEGVRAGDLKLVRIGNHDVRFRWCPPVKSFKMGSPKTEADRNHDEDQVDVTLTRGYWMLETEVTQGLWQTLMKTELDWSSKGKAANLPVYT
jgi:serine/threonine protein kinase